MNKFFRLSVKKKIKLKHSTQEVWKVISSPGNLNLFHPFCKSNKVIKLNNSIIKRDQLVYHNGLTFLGIFINGMRPRDISFTLEQKMVKNPKWSGNFHPKTITRFYQLKFIHTSLPNTQ